MPKPNFLFLVPPGARTHASTSRVLTRPTLELRTGGVRNDAIDSASSGTLLGQTVQCDYYASVRPPPSGPRNGRGSRDQSASSRRTQKVW